MFAGNYVNTIFYYWCGWPADPELLLGGIGAPLVRDRRFADAKAALGKETKSPYTRSGLEYTEMRWEMRVYAAKLTAGVSDFDLDRIASRLTPERQERIRKFVSKEDARRSVLAELMLRQIILESLGLSGKEISFGANSYGKPFLVGIGDFHFNLSHSGEWVVCVTDNAPVGIDIEMIRPVEYNIARKFFLPAEYGDLMAKNEAERLHYFFSLWTLKESYIKARGEGFARPLDSFSIRIDEGGNVRLETEDMPGGWFFKRYGIDYRYKMAVCAAHGGLPEAVIVQDWHDYLGTAF
ncbi:4'-phosphopantetheinyl transferase [Desulfofarcimen acetoxidans DSM 771]|uniref:4'-phosphopantetheinyl transferase n=1 Tax=Desulfofarcimen acetoxidans (strain ATCC 49208 / DSM 771 / KCTC 5769 / VKM B-1644 / 5575) TaxID=485916 RepID=C8W355_DESAS|nr:4'-phosphopantetheinyl transferase superfamily protein [Desulfofarcimen acetoxidans]ACV61822.1 4'-phosphopantetheinyl transferase [Desulfofarcimen acetoxidans DSM 771]